MLTRMLFEAGMKLLGCVHGHIITLEYGRVQQQYTNHSKNLMIYDVEIFIRSNPGSDVSESTSYIPSSSLPNHNRIGLMLDCSKQTAPIVCVVWESPYIRPAICRKQ